jgi:hypothetical protein
MLSNFLQSNGLQDGYGFGDVIAIYDDTIQGILEMSKYYKSFPEDRRPLIILPENSRFRTCFYFYQRQEAKDKYVPLQKIIEQSNKINKGLKK